jgi:hypothetical protein
MSITSADAIVYLSIVGLFNTPQQLQGFAVDDIFDTQPKNPDETELGADGGFTAGWKPTPTVQGFAFRADADSNKMFDIWNETQDANRTIFYANGTVILNALGRKWTMTRGVLTTYAPMPDAKGTLKTRKHGITWQRVSPANV